MIEAKRTLLIPYKRKINANRTLLIHELKKIKAKRTWLIPEKGKIGAKKTNGIEVVPLTSACSTCQREKV